MSATKRFFTILSILLLSDVITVIIGFKHSQDMSIIWLPTIALIYTLSSSIYSTLFLLIDKIHPTSQRYTIIYNTLLAITLITLGILFYTVKIDWYAINHGQATLTPWQSIVRSDATYFVILTFFLIIHLIRATFLRIFPSSRLTFSRFNL